MTIDETTQKVKELAAKKGGAIGSKIKFKLDEGIIFLDDSVSPTVVTNEDATADCVIRMSSASFHKLLEGEMNAVAAYMMGKIKIDGDMGIAMKLSSMF